MYSKAVRDLLMWKYSIFKGLNARYIRAAFAADPIKPHMVSQYPGKKYLESLDNLQSQVSEDDYSSALKSFVNFKQSKGNYFVDVDGNTVLDLNAGAAGFTLGYNADDAVNSRFSSVYDRFVTHKVNANALPTHDMADLIRDNVMPSAPLGQACVHLGAGSTGTEANELAVAVAMKHYAKTHGVDSMSKLCVVGFNNSNHGDSTAALSFSSVDANSKDLPAFPWPKAEFPKLRYPLAYNQKANAAEEDRCV